MTTPNPTTFKEHYHVLRENAQILQSNEIDIDELPKLVENSLKAYHQCVSRLDAIEASLKETLGSLEQKE